VVTSASGQTNSFTAVDDSDTLLAVRSATNFVDLTDSGFGYTVPAFDFAEASVDLSKIGVTTGCPGFSTGHIRSRTGGDPGSSQLKDAAPPFNIDLNNCGKVTIIKNAVPNDAQDFHYTATGGAPLADFDLDNDGDNSNALSNKKTFDQVPPGDYTVTEGATAGWKLTDLSCDDGNSTVDLNTGKATIKVGANEHVTCTYTNTKLGSITIVKDAVPNDDQDFAYSGALGAFNLDDDGNNGNTLSNTKTVTGLEPGSYAVTEAAAAGWDLTALSCNDGGTTTDLATRTATIDLDAGEDITCTYTNTKRGSITIIKDAVPNDPQDFAFTGLGGFSLDDDGDNGNTLSNTFVAPNLTPGSYTVTEGDVSGWELTGLTCNDGDGGTTVSVADRKAVIDLDPGQSITCTYVNTKAGRIIVDKVTDPSGDPQSFTFTTTGAGYTGFSLTDAAQPHDSGDLKPGTYSVAEQTPAGWDLTSATCTGGQSPESINLAAGQTVTCTFNNQKDANIVVVKQTDPDGDPASFEFDTNYGSNFSLKDGQQNDSGDLDPGTYSVAELPAAGWDLTSATCSDGSNPAAIGLSAGETVTCTFNNQKDAHIIVVKQTDPDGDPASFEFDSNYGSNFSLKDGEQNDSGDLDPGTYSVAELTPAGWDLTSSTCSDGSNPSAIGLSAGETVTCTFTNTKRGTIIVKKMTSPTDTQDTFTFSGDASGSIGNGGTITKTNLVPGTYTSVEAVKAGWDLGSIVCDDVQSDSASSGDVATRTATFKLDPGETVTCTFFNAQRGTITIIKDAQPNGPQDFHYDFTGLEGPVAFDLDDDNDGTLSNLKSFSDLVAGSYSVTEADLEGWDLTSLECETFGTGTSAKIDAATAELTLADGGSITCTYVNSKPSIEIVKTAGDAEDGDEFVSPPGPVTYHYHVTNSGPVALENIVVTDDNGTPGNASDDFTADCPKTTLDAGESMDCSKTVTVTADRTNTGTANGFSLKGTPVTDSDIAFVRIPGVGIDKSADDDLVEQNQTVTYTITVTVESGPVSDATVTDTLPVGQTYVAGSSKVNGSPSEPVVTDGGKTLTWSLGTLDDEDSGLEITYDVTIDANATTDTQVNEVTLCVSELPKCEESHEDVTPQIPSISIVKTAGDAVDGEVYTTEAGPVTYTYVVTNTGPLALHAVVVTDDNGTPGDTSDDFELDCPKDTLAVTESMTCTSTRTITVDTTNIALVTGLSPENNPVSDADNAVVEILEHGLVIAKSNNAPLKPIQLPDGTTVEIPTAPEGTTVEFTLNYTFTGDPVTSGIITDVIPVGLTYQAGTATNSDEFTFQNYNPATRTLTWTAEEVTKNGTVTYKAKVDVGAAKLTQPLINVATIDSAQTEPDSDTSQVFVPAPPKVETGPPTDIEGTVPGAPGSSLPLILAILGVILLTVAFVTPVPAAARRRNRQR
jgi:fimbrial isopeptide formation D2 family protein